MNKKKIGALLVASILAIASIGGTLAWFTSSNTVKNEFSTGTIVDATDKDNDGIQVEETFNPDEAANITPGTDVNKDVEIRNTASYDQFIRTKLVVTLYDVATDGTKTPIEATDSRYNDLLNKVEFNFTTAYDNGNPVANATGTWVKEGEYYYYLDKVASGASTKQLLDSVKLSGNAGNEFKNIAFDVDVVADSIQASNDAYADNWAPTSLQSVYGNLQ